MRVVAGVSTDVGRIRQANEDAYLVREPLFVVADGMGGHLAGDVASSTAVEVISASTGDDGATDPESLISLLREANASIHGKAESDPSLRGMGTTCTLLLVDGARAYIAHVGDSRAYLLRDGELSQLTEDHSLVSRLVREGRLTSEEAEIHPQRSIITRALGVDTDVEVDTLSLELQDRDRLLLCSDGLSSMIDSRTIRETLESVEGAQEAADALVRLANEAGGEDNITVVVVDITSAPPTPPPAEDRSEAPDEHSSGSGLSAEAPAGETRRHDTPGARDEGVPRKSPWRRRIFFVVIVLVLLGGGVYAAARYALDNSFYVGFDDNRTVTIYRGIPDEVFGLSLSESQESTSLKANDLQDFQRDDVQENKKFTSLEAARTYVENLERNAESIGSERARKRRNKS